MTVQAWVAADGSGRQAATFPARCAALDFDQSYTRGGLPWQIYGVVRAGTLPTSPAAPERAPWPLSTGTRPRPVRGHVPERGLEARPRRCTGPATDRLGRHGQAVGLVTSGTRDELIFDPASTVVLEEQTVAVAPRQGGNNMLPPGTVLQYTAYLRAAVVNSDTAIPR